MAQATTYRLITGICPGLKPHVKCFAVGSIQSIGSPEGTMLRCVHCQTSFSLDNLPKLAHGLVDVTCTQDDALLMSPSYTEVPHHDLIWRVLRQAVMSHFSISASNRGVSGVDGLIGGGRVRLITTQASNQLGICRPDPLVPTNPGEQQALEFFGLLLRKLFFEELMIGDQSCGRARLLRLSTSAADELQAYAVLGEVLAQASDDREFPRLVFSALSRKHPEFLEKWAASLQPGVFSLLRRS